ncbi:hypothetical protein [Actinoplanes missouriensis]
MVAAVLVVLRPRRAARARLPGRRRAPARFDPARVRRWRAHLTTGPAWRPVLAAAGLASVPALLAGGPAGAAIAAVYAALAAGEWARRDRRKRASAARAAELDRLCALVADLRAGLPPVAAAGFPGYSAGGVPGYSAAGPSDTADPLGAGSGGAGPSGAAEGGAGRIRELVAAVWRLAEQTGAPAADLLDRIESDARSTDRTTATAAAQAAGAQATALLLAGLPLGGIGLGYAIGADPLAVLLRTPVGVACALTAVLLQVAGLRWSQRLVDGPR